MSIYYALISRGTVLLVDYTESSGNFEQITASMLHKIPREDTKCTYVSEGYQFHVIVEDGLTYLCLADASMGKRVPYGFLHEIKRRFTSGALKIRAMTCNAYELRRDFGQVLSTQLTKFNRGDGTDAGIESIRKVQKEVDEVKGVMTKNIEKVLERGERLDILIEKTEDLEASAASFKKSARKVRNKYWWQNTRNCILLIFVILVLLGVIALIILGALVVYKMNKTFVVESENGSYLSGDSLDYGGSTRSLLTPLYASDYESRSRSSSFSSSELDEKEDIYSQDFTINARYKYTTVADIEKERKVTGRPVRRTEDQKIAQERAISQKPSKHRKIFTKSWEEWLIEKAVEDLKKVELSKDVKRQKRLAQFKKREEKVEIERKAEENRLRWLAQKNFEQKKEKKERAAQLEYDKLKKQQSEQIINNKAKKAYDEWLETKKAESKVQKEKERQEKLEQNKKKIIQARLNEISYRKWKQKTKKRLKQRPNSATSSDNIGYYDYYIRANVPEPGYVNPAPWQGVVDSRTDEFRRRYREDQCFQSPPLLWKDYEDRSRKKQIERKSAAKKTTIFQYFIVNSNDATAKVIDTVKLPTCTHIDQRKNVTLRGGITSGKFTKHGYVKDLETCVDACCRDELCNVAFMPGRVCYTVQCFSEELCQSIPASPSQAANGSVQISHIVRGGGKGDDVDEFRTKFGINKNRSPQKAKCMPGRILYNYSLEGGKFAGEMMDFGTVVDVHNCSQVCCEHSSCEVAYISKDKCIGVGCLTQELCRSRPNEPEEDDSILIYMNKRDNARQADKDTCNEPCVNGLCTRNDTCACDPGYRGPNCDEEETAGKCDPPCGENGACQANDTCSCNEGFTGYKCDEKVVCKEPCINGICIEQYNGSTACSCDSPWEGAHCNTTNSDKHVTASSGEEVMFTDMDPEAEMDIKIHESPNVKDTESISALTVAIGCGIAAALVGTAAVIFIARQVFGKKSVSNYELLGQSLPKYRHH
eukprot:gene12782-14093_t